MEILRRPGQFDKLEETGQRLMDMQARALSAAGIAHQIVGEPPLFDIVFTDKKVRDYRDVLTADAEKNVRYNSVLRNEGIFKSPGKMYPCLALNEEDLNRTEAAVNAAAAAL